MINITGLFSHSLVPLFDREKDLHSAVPPKSFTFHVHSQFTYARVHTGQKSAKYSAKDVIPQRSETLRPPSSVSETTVAPALQGATMEPADGADSVFLNLAASFTSAVENSTRNQESFDSSDEEPLITKVDTGFNSSDNEPLITKLGANSCSSDDEPLIQKTGHQEFSQHSTPIKDPNYEPLDDGDESTGNSSSSTQSEAGTSSKKLRRRKKRHGRAGDLQRVKSASLEEHRAFLNNLQCHKTRLDNLLAANGLSRQEVNADGNCFFEAAVFHLEDITSLELRDCLCMYLEDNFGTYMPFIGQREGEDENERYLRFFCNVHELRNPGAWSNDACDLLPQVLADWAERPIKIYSSNIFSSVMDILPSNTEPGLAQQRATQPITLAFTDCDPRHYDACNQHEKQNVEETTAGAHHGQQREPADSTEGGTKSPETATSGDQQQITPRKQGQGETKSPETATSGDQQQITPRKQGVFHTPPKKTLVRKREAKPETWKKNIRKSLHLKGLEYVSQKGKVVPAKKLRQVDCSKCKYCCSTITDEQQQHVFDTFYALESSNRQKDFVCSCVQQKSTVTVLGEDGEPVKKRRQTCRMYYFNIEGQAVRVCKKFFLATLAVGETYVDHALKNSRSGTYIDQGLRVKRPHNKTSDIMVEQVKEHIASFPVVESHYARKDTQRMYLPTSLSVKKMHELYLQHCKEQGYQSVSLKKYRQVFNENFNFSFHTPKKDQCATCTTYSMKAKQGLVTEEDKEAYQQHMHRKQQAREEKEKDKREAKTDPSKHVVTVDLQAVLQAPCGLVSQLYYKRKLSVYNFTVYSLADGKGTCYTWDETEGKRGSCEIATCLYFYLSSLPRCVEDVVIFSDCCAGQNRNQYLAAALMHAVNNIDNLKSITHKYLETGHTQMECDSMHAAIGFAKKITPIYTPSGWDNIFRFARRARPYTVIPLKHGDVLDFKRLASDVIRNTKTDLKGRRVHWLNIKCLKFVQGQEEMMFFKYSFDQDDFNALKLVGSSKRGKTPTPLTATIKQCYKAKLPVSQAKKQDLLSLCNSGIIPDEHHPFYRALPTSGDAKDKLPEPDIEEEDRDSE